MQTQQQSAVAALTSQAAEVESWFSQGTANLHTVMTKLGGMFTDNYIINLHTR